MSFCSEEGMPSREAMERQWETAAAMGPMNERPSPSIGGAVTHGTEQSLTWTVWNLPLPSGKAGSSS